MLVLLTALLASARPPAGVTQVVVVMKSAHCPVCATQIRQLDDAALGASLMGITHDSDADAARATNATGVPTYSHPAGIEAMGLWMESMGIAQPAVVVYDRCGEETGRIVGRRPGADVTEDVRSLVKQADAVKACSKPQT